jgi:hypothetical protein
MKNKKITIPEFTITPEKLRTLDRTKYIKIIKNKQKLKNTDVYIPIRKNNKIVYVVAQGDDYNE